MRRAAAVADDVDRRCGEAGVLERLVDRHGVAERCSSFMSKIVSTDRAAGARPRAARAKDEPYSTSRCSPRWYQTRCGISCTSGCAPVASDERQTGRQRRETSSPRARYSPRSASSASVGAVRRSTASSNIAGVSPSMTISSALVAGKDPKTGVALACAAAEAEREHRQRERLEVAERPGRTRARRGRAAATATSSAVPPACRRGERARATTGAAPPTTPPSTPATIPPARAGQIPSEQPAAAAATSAMAESARARRRDADRRARRVPSRGPRDADPVPGCPSGQCTDEFDVAVKREFRAPFA